jgi:hypothetical protein
MGRNNTLQVLRGSEANLQSAMPLALGEMYFSTDTSKLFFGTPGTGLGYVQIGNVLGLDDEIACLRIRVQALELALADLGINVEEYEAEDIGEYVNGS